MYIHSLYTAKRAAHGSLFRSLIYAIFPAGTQVYGIKFPVCRKGKNDSMYHTYTIALVTGGAWQANRCRLCVRPPITLPYYIYTSVNKCSGII